MQQGVRSKNHPPRPPFLPRHYITCRLWIFSRKANGGGPDHRGCCSHKPRLFATPTDGRFWKSVCRQGGGPGNSRRRGRSIVEWSPYPPCENLRPAENPSTDGFCETVVSKGDGIGGACLNPPSEEQPDVSAARAAGNWQRVFRGGWGADGSPRSGRQTARQRRANSPEIGKNTPCRRSPAGSPTACPGADGQ